MGEIFLYFSETHSSSIFLSSLFFNALGLYIYFYIDLEKEKNILSL
jgi:hypothetical protein